MVEHGVHHLVVTGSDGHATGVVRAVDLAHFEVREPLQLRASIDTATTVDGLAGVCRQIPATLVELRTNGLPARHGGAIQTALLEAVLRRLLAMRGDPSLLGVSWLFLGSLARREPLPSSDVDTALLWDDPPPATPDAIRAAAAGVLGDLRHCGLSPCPNGANADNPLFSRSRSGWADATSRWARESTVDGALLLSAMVADSRPVTETDLGRHVTDLLMSRTRTSQFLRALLDEAVGWRTPTGVLRDFIVDHHADHRGEFDLKRGGLVPIVALGRWIGIVTRDGHGTTPERLDRGAAAGLITDDERHTLGLGFDSVYTILYDLEVQALQNGGTPTTYVNPHHLDTLTRRHLRETLRAVHDVQGRIDQSWIRRLDG
jgi:CBS domain-containing protein